MFQTKSPEKGFVFHFNILGDGVVFSGLVFLSISPPLVCLDWFGLEGLRGNLGKGSASWVLSQVPDTEPDI